LLVASVCVAVAALAGCGSSTFRAGDIPKVVAFSSKAGWSPHLPRRASTPAAIAKAIASPAVFGKPIAVKVFHTAVGVGLTIHVPFHGRIDGSPPSVLNVLDANWKASLVESVLPEAFAERGIRLNADRVTVIGQLTDGTTEVLGQGGGVIRKGRDFSDGSDAAIKHELTAVLHAAHLTPVSITVVRVGQPAPAVVVKTDQPHAAQLVAPSRMQQLFGDYEGCYLVVKSPSGQPLAAIWQNGRTGELTGWGNPSA
jgi:hypothetical protein